MALIKCPECGAKISDQAASCPHCGYAPGQPSKKRSTPLAPVEKHVAMGTLYIVTGIGTLFFGFALAITIIGIVIAFLGMGLIGLGVSAFSGDQKGKCPYCGNAVQVPASQKDTFKCTHCKRICNRFADSLETID